MSKSSARFISASFTILFAFFLFFNDTKVTEAIDFGGKILFAVPCTCSVPGTMILTVGPPRPGKFLYVPKISRPYAYFVPTVGRWIIGSAKEAPKACLMTATPCTTAGLYPPISRFGTSLR